MGNQRGAPLVLFGFPDEERQETRWAIEIPNLASLILTHEAEGEIKGLNEFEGQHPPVAPVFWAFRIMVGMGTLMVLVAWWAGWGLRGGRTLGARPLAALSWMTFSGWIAVLAGWYVTEIGRQPWIVQGLLQTADVVADHSTATLSGTLLGYLLLYVFLLASYIGALRYLSTKPARSLELQPGYTTVANRA